ncbi:LapA family protein [Candidatus Williamhamiltonella defendens]|uniref:LapA family protein n=1 Tax=Candidatus Williamhamiltonella defendens TaxID=138072 RepID=UPI00130D7EF7|nr:lipopolysaccharide assembly protein LapA domain-containing protein [Candidatus Hamiltonella defensa]
MKFVIIFLLVCILSVILIIFEANNKEEVVFNYLLAQNSYRLSSLIVNFFLTGLFLGWIIMGIFYIKVRIALMKAKRKIKKLTLNQDQRIKNGANLKIIDDKKRFF